MSRQRSLRALVWSILLAFWVGGCQCVGIVKRADDSDPGQHQGTDAGRAPITPPPSGDRGRYQIRGVAMVAFYPGIRDDDARSIDPAVGTMNGYVILYSALEQTEIAAWRLDDDTCQRSTQTPGDDNKKGTPIVGLDGGKAVHLQLEGVEYALERREHRVSGSDKEPAPQHVIYNVPTVSSYRFPYEQKVRFVSGGEADFPPFQIELAAPARLDVLSPTLVADGLDVTRSQGMALRWKTQAAMPYVAVRINQRDPSSDQTHSLLCRFANDGEATIPADSLAALAADPTGQHTQIFFSPTSYKLAQVKGLEKPILAVVRATTTLPLRLR